MKDENRYNIGSGERVETHKISWSVTGQFCATEGYLQAKLANGRDVVWKWQIRTGICEISSCSLLKDGLQQIQL